MTPLAAALAAILIAVTHELAGAFATPVMALMVAAATCLAPPGAPERGRSALDPNDRPAATS